MLPVFGRKVIEGQQCVSILDQTLGCPVVLDAPGFDEGIKCEQRILLGFQPSRSPADLARVVRPAAKAQLNEVAISSDRFLF